MTTIPRASRAPTRIALAAIVFVLTGTGCGAEDRVEGSQTDETPVTATDTPPTEPSEESGSATRKTGEPNPAVRPPGAEGLRVAATRARIVARQSQYGDVLFDANGQVVYVFEIDHPNRSNCTSEECVQAWPPVLTKQPPTAAAGVDEHLLGTIRRSDGRLQVTYHRRPLYFYEHEGPGEIRCHNVELHGGLWWVVTPSGDAAA